MSIDRSPLRLGGPLIVPLWAIGVSAGLVACGGRAADGPEGLDGLEPEENKPGVSVPVDQPSIEPMRETCEDNPLLAGCRSSAGGNPAPRDEPLEVPEEEPLYIAAARNVLAANCGACHGPALAQDQASAGINYITDWGRLAQAGLIEPCLPGSSLLIGVMRSGEMPPPTSGLPPVAEADIGVVTVAIELDCNLY